MCPFQDLNAKLYPFQNRMAKIDTLRYLLIGCWSSFDRGVKKWHLHDYSCLMISIQNDTGNPWGLNRFVNKAKWFWENQLHACKVNQYVSIIRWVLRIFVSLCLKPEAFNGDFLKTWGFLWKVLAEVYLQKIRSTVLCTCIIIP